MEVWNNNCRMVWYRLLDCERMMSVCTRDSTVNPIYIYPCQLYMIASYIVMHLLESRMSYVCRENKYQAVPEAP